MGRVRKHTHKHTHIHRERETDTHRDTHTHTETQRHTDTHMLHKAWTNSASRESEQTHVLMLGPRTSDSLHWDVRLES